MHKKVTSNIEGSSLIHLPYISQAVERIMYEEPNNCNTDLGTELSCVKNRCASQLFRCAFSWGNNGESIDFGRLLSHVVLKTPSVVIVELSEPNSLIKWEHNLNSCNKEIGNGKGFHKILILHVTRFRKTVNRITKGTKYLANIDWKCSQLHGSFGTKWQQRSLHMLQIKI
jgi:hypothetical protein